MVTKVLDTKDSLLRILLQTQSSGADGKTLFCKALIELFEARTLLGPQQVALVSSTCLHVTPADSGLAS
jgi:hypothetical protein